MASTLSDFTLSAAAAPDDFIVGYDEAALNGERRWTVSTIANTVTRKNDIGNSNTAFGIQTLQSNTTGVNNTAFGYQSLEANTIGTDNTAVGRNALVTNTAGVYNTAVGTSALYANTTGYDNTAVGGAALFSNTTGYDNTAVGRFALDSNTTGFGNTAVGHDAGTNATTNSNCTYIGYGVGGTAGENNVVRIGNADITENYFIGTVNTTGNYRAGNGAATAVAYGFADDANTGIFSPDNERISFSINGTQCMTNVGGSFYFGDIAKTVTSSWNVHDNTGDGNSTGIKIDGGDAIQISNAGPCLYLRNQLAENTGITNTIAFYGANSTSVDADYRGSIAINGNTISFNNVSDVRLKENIEDAPSCSEAIDKIKVRSFDWKSGKFPRVPYGFIAQELDEAVKYVAPGAVSKGTAETQDMWGVSTTELIPLLVKEIQDLRKRVSELENK